MPLIWLSLGLGDEQPGTEQFTVAISGLIFSIVSLGLLGALPLNHCYAFYLELHDDHVRWRNWRWKERTFTYPSITFAHVENNGKNGFLRIGSTEMGKRTCSFDPYQFDATILMAQVLYRDDHGRWAEVGVTKSERQKRRRRVARNEARRLERQQAREEARREKE